MDATLVLVAAVSGAALFWLWLSHLRRDLRRRTGRWSEWDGVQDSGELWTSAARCPQCRASGALLRRQGDTLWHSCMSCGHRHVRQHRA